MTRTQIQLPNDVYARARALCRQREISLAELARRGLEYILSVYSEDPVGGNDWQPPQPRSLGWKGLSDPEIKAQAQITPAEARATRLRRK